MRPVLYLIDGHAVAYRQFFGLPVGSFTTRDGEPTNATFGFTRILLDILEKDKPQYLAVSFDMGLSGRDALYADYKGTREKMPGELAQQLNRIQQIVAAFNIPILALEGYEADDVIGTITQQATAQGVGVHIITGDRDLLQLLTEGVTVQLPSSKGADEIFDVPRFVEKYGVQPPQLVDLKALMGDASDNIPGVKGIGDKTATQLLQSYHTLDGIYANLDAIKGATQQKLIAGRDSAYLSRQLAQIQHDVPLMLDLAACVAHEFDAEAVLSVFEQVNFRTLRDRLSRLTTLSTSNMFNSDDFEADDNADIDADLMDFAPPARAEASVNTVIVRDNEALAALVQTLNAAQRIVFDLETTSIDQMQAELVGIALSTDGQTGYYIPVGHQEGRQLALQTVLDALRAPLTDATIPKAAHNAVYDLVIMQRYGIDVTPIDFDTMIAEWLLNVESRNLGLKNLVFATLKDESGKPILMTPIDELIGTGKNQTTFNTLDIQRAAPYAAADATLTHRLVDILQPRLQRQHMTALYDTLEMPLVPVISAMQQAGVVLDIRYLADLSERLAAQLKVIETDIHSLTGGYGAFNINSPKQLNDVLFGKLGLPTKGLKKTTHGYSTDAAVLEGLQDAHPIVRRILEYRELMKLKGTYVDALPLLINPHTGRVHTSYNQTGTSTGRLSSNSPNLQNIPIRTEVGREVRRAFLAPEGKLLLSVDYSQVELRILAHISRDVTLVAAFQQGLDIHAATAAAVYGIPVESVTKAQRNFAKRVNFGLIYGMGAYRLARDSDLTLSQADAFIKTYFERLPGVQAYLAETKRKAREGDLETLFGRRRRFSGLIEGRANKTIQAAEERAAINMPIQGTAADIMKRAMIDIHAELKQRGLKALMTLQVHDELVFEAPEAEIDTLRTLVVDLMERAYPLDPALKANAAVGLNWRDMA
ncbi:MAG: DNA polymerase I [Armatimonadetes bacterium]|nr:DNA polymerase I [Anaerolineae bacterium]